VWSGQSIDAINQEAAEEARRLRKVPHVPRSPDEVDDYRPVPFPSLCDYCPGDWVRTDDEPWFVDSTGYGTEDEPALTTDAFKAILREYIEEHPEYGFGLTCCGPHQVYVGAFMPIDRN
jgi:hypothetical protein